MSSLDRFVVRIESFSLIIQDLLNRTEIINTIQELFVKDNIFDTVGQWSFYIGYALVFILGLLANISVLLCFIKNRKHLTPPNLLLINLMIVGLLQCSIVIPTSAVTVTHKQWRFGSGLCSFVPFAQGFVIFGTTGTISCIAWDRMHRITVDGQHPEKVDWKDFGRLALIWSVAALLSAPLLYAQEMIQVGVLPIAPYYKCVENWPHFAMRPAYTLIILSAQFLTPFGVLLISYRRIRLFLKRQEIIPESIVLLQQSSRSGGTSPIERKMRQVTLQDPELNGRENPVVELHDPKFPSSSQGLKEMSFNPNQTESSSTDPRGSSSDPRGSSSTDRRRLSTSDTAVTVGKPPEDVIETLPSPQTPVSMRRMRDEEGKMVDRRRFVALYGTKRKCHRFSSTRSNRSDGSRNSSKAFGRERMLERALKRNRKVVRSLILTTLVFVMTWVPWNVCNLWLDFVDIKSIKFDSVIIHMAIGVTHLIAMTSAISNPYMYGWRNPSIKEELKKQAVDTWDAVSAYCPSRRASSSSVHIEPEKEEKEESPAHDAISIEDNEGRPTNDPQKSSPQEWL